MCTFFNCPIPAPEGKMCIGHQKLFGKSTTTPATPMPKESAKIKVTKQELRKKVALYLSKPENKYCRIKGPNCTKVATQVNHTNGRSENVLNEDDWEPSCTNCNVIHIEQNHAEAQENGHKKQRHNKENLRGKAKQINQAKSIS